MRITRGALARPLVVLAIAGSLTACGDDGNTDVNRNEQECGTAEDSGDCAETEGPSTQTSESEG
jgi:predicted small lipoprotein YifL